MPTLGEVLREERQRLNLSLEQIEATTKIRKKYLIALEADDYPSLPPAVYTRGFIQIYASTLGLDPAGVDKLYEPAEGPAPSPSIRPAATGLKEVRGISFRGMLTFIVIVLGVVGVVYLYAQYLSYTSIATSDAGAAPKATVLATPTFYAVAAAVPTATATPLPTASPTPRTGVEVVINVTERSWLRVMVDGLSAPAFEGELQAGATRTWTAKDKVDMRVGNAGGLEVTVNGMKQGKLGASGEVKTVTWGRQ